MAGAQTAAASASLAIRITPRLQGGKVGTIDVEETIGAPALKPGQTLLRMPIVSVNEPAALGDPKTLAARDAAGELGLTIADDPPDPSNFKQERTWAPVRATVGDVIVRYQASPRVITPQTHAGPLIDVRAEGQGIEGALSLLLALPDTAWPRPVRLSWNLLEMPAGARAATSLGEGLSLTDTVSRETLGRSIFMVGPLHSVPPDGKGAFAVYWLTEPEWDLAGAADWTHKVYDYYTRFWGASEQPFRIFMRTTERFQGGGGGSFHSFIFGTVAGEKRDPDEVRDLMAHEAGHNFVGQLTDPGTGAQWYSEGANVYYTAVLPYRAGLVSLQHYQKVISTLVTGYYLNPLSNLPNAQVTRRFFKEHDAEVVSYQRGPLYFAAVDARLRAATGGRRRVDDLIKAMVAAQRDHRPVDAGLWASLVRGALGDAGLADFEGMMAGRPLDLPSDLFGACFRREPFSYHRYTLGFMPLVTDGVRRATRLDPQSPAAWAGLQEGDVILDTGRLEGEQGDVRTPLTLHLQRSSGAVAVTFNPWSDQAIPGFRWVRTSAPATACDI
jgi:predicted metalloprotease with PDZ domain